jgi:NADH-quinone oxidoreductase subunit J
MTPLQLVFMLAAVITLGSALMVVSTRNILHAALWLVSSLFGVAILFALLQANFFAVVQVVVYIGAIAILVIFAVMLTRRVMQDRGSQLIRTWWLAALVAAAVFGGLVYMLSNWGGFWSLPPTLTNVDASLTQLGLALVSPNAYMVPFEVASVLLLAALIGAIYVAFQKK